MIHYLRIRYVQILIAIIVLIGCGWYITPFFMHKAAETKVAYRANNQPISSSNTEKIFQLSEKQLESLVIKDIVAKVLYPTIKADGKIAENENTTSSVFAPYSGRVTALFHKIGDQVTIGDPLLQVASPDYLSALARLKLAKTNEWRQQQRYQAKTGSLKDWQQAQAELESAQSNIFLETAEVKAIPHKLQTNKLNKDDAVITAPITGRIIQRQVGLGQYINSASGGAATPLFTIGDFSTIWLLANIREIDAPLIHLGQEVEVAVLAYPNRKFNASIVYIAPTIDPVTHRLPVRADIKNTDEALKPGMFASFSIITGKGVDGFIIPEDAIIYEGADTHVWVFNPSNRTITLRNIKIQSINNDGVEIISGLVKNEKIIAGGSLFIDRVAKSDNENSSDNNNIK